MNIKPYDTTIRKLFQSGFYKIPRFQRPYSWDKENVEDFWADIILAEKTDHFIGSMVLYAGVNQDLFVVDGQQRLTTITIFLAALRDSLNDLGEKGLAKGIQSIIQRPDISSEERYVLITETSYPYFQEYIQKLGNRELDLSPTEEEEGIINAYEFAKTGFSALIDQIKARKLQTKQQQKSITESLEKARDALLSLDVIVIQLDNEDDAHVVFETLNTRGKDLESKDLIKNLLMKLLRPKGAAVDTARIKWNKIISSIAESSTNVSASTYIHHYWLSRYEYMPERTLFVGFKKHIKDKKAAGEFLDNLLIDVDSYRRIFEPDAFDWKKEEDSLRSSLVALAIFKVRQPAPLILAILRAYYAKEISLKQARDTLAAVERFHFMYTAIAGQSSSGGVSKMYAAAGRDLTAAASGQTRARQLQAFKAKLGDKSPELGRFTAGFTQLRYSQSDTRDRPLVRYVLTKIDSNLRPDAIVDYSKMTVEHIAPQNPVGGSKPLSNYSTLGNLILVSEKLNGKLKNKSFPDKKAILLAAGVPLEDGIKTAKQWGEAEINSRTNQLSKLIYTKAI